MELCCVISIQEQLDKGIIERVPNSDESNGPVHYLPHLPVVRTDRSTTKVRVVYDGSAKSNESSLSLNDCLHKGPDLTQSQSSLMYLLVSVTTL